MEIVLDANILCGDFHLQGRNFQLLLSEASRIPAVVHIPEVALDETVNKYRERLEELSEQSSRISAKLRKLVLQEVRPHIAEESIPSLVDSYRGRLEDRLETTGVIVLPYPTISHRDVVRRDLARLPPFRKGGAGYRDALIWETFLCFCVDHPGSTAIFVTANSRDFGEGPDLPPQMDSEFRSRRRYPGEGANVRICAGLGQLCNDLILPRLEQVSEGDTLRSILDSERPDIHLWLAREAPRLLQDMRLGMVCVGFEPLYGSVRVVSVDQIRDLDISQAHRLTSGNVLLTVFANLVLVIEVSADGRDWEASPKIRDFFGEVGSSFEYSCVSSTVRAELSLIVAPETGEIVAAEVRSIEGETGAVGSATKTT